MTIKELKNVLSVIDDTKIVYVSVSHEPGSVEEFSCEMALYVQECKHHIVISDAE
jgi:hypothetical protein